MHRDGDRLVIEPVRKRGLIALLKSMTPLDEEFPRVDDPVRDLVHDSSVGFAWLLSIELIRAWRTPASFARSCCDHDFLCRSRRTLRARSCLVCPEFRLAIDQDDAFGRKRLDTL